MSVLPVVLKARAQHTATMIFLHGLGDTGHGWAGILNTIRPDHVKLVCPTAPSIPVTLNGGYVMPAWYDIRDIGQDRSAIREDLDGVEASTKVLEALIDMEARELKNESKSRIIVGGFSQGGAIALNAVLRAKQNWAGCVALSTYIPGDKLPALETKIKTPIFHCHGEADEMISIERGRKTADAVRSVAETHQFHTFPHMGHSADDDELELLRDFIAKQLPFNPGNSL